MLWITAAELCDHGGKPGIRIYIMKIASFLSGIILYMACASAGAQTAIKPDGDINLDGSLETADILWGLEVLFDRRALNSTQLAHGDVAPLVAEHPVEEW
jgi:hypothetical protein